MYIAVPSEPTAWLTSILPWLSALKTLSFAMAFDYGDDGGRPTRPRLRRRTGKSVRIPKHQVPPANGAPEMVDRAVPRLAGSGRVRRHHLHDDSASVDVVLLKESLDVAAAQLA